MTAEDELAEFPLTVLLFNVRVAVPPPEDQLLIPPPPVVVPLSVLLRPCRRFRQQGANPALVGRQAGVAAAAGGSWLPNPDLIRLSG